MLLGYNLGNMVLMGKVENDSIVTIATKIDKLLSSNKLKLRKNEDLDEPINGNNYSVFDQITK